MKKNRRYSSVENKDGMSGEELLSEDMKNADSNGANTEYDIDCGGIPVPDLGEIADEDSFELNGDTEDGAFDEGTDSADGDFDGEASADVENRGEQTDGDTETVESESSDDAATPAKEVKPISFAEKLFNFTELLVFTLAAVVLLLSFVFRHAEVIGNSMDTTLANGEHLIISDLFYTPERGDIIVFEDHSTIYKKPLIKRVIAVGGDHIRIKNGVVHLNGALLDESEYIGDVYTMGNVDMIVPEGEVFVMGDNRGASDDSRNNLIGTIDEDAILGKVILRFFPFDSFGSVER